MSTASTAAAPQAPEKLLRKSKGKRPHFFADPAIDQVMSMIVAMAGELSIVYDRLDTMERLLDTKGTVSRADIEAYRADAAVEKERAARREQSLHRIFRVIDLVKEKSE
jgi:hypothetical protein